VADEILRESAGAESATLARVSIAVVGTMCGPRQPSGQHPRAARRW